MTMKNYHLYVFDQDGSDPSLLLKNHLQTLTDSERSELDFVSLTTPSGERSMLADELQVDCSPTLVVVHESVQCDIDWTTDEEYCELEEKPVERFLGVDGISSCLQSTLDAYTYAHLE